MPAHPFLQRLAEPRPLLLDGATGTELNRRGVSTDLPLWSARALLEAPDILRQIHADYLAAGAEVLTTNTFRAHRRSLARAGLGARARELTFLAAQIAAEIPNPKSQIPNQKTGDRGPETEIPNLKSQIPNLKSQIILAGSLAPLEDCYSPELVPPPAECEREHAEMAQNLAEAGVDFILIETMNTAREAAAAAQAAAATGLPFAVSFVCRSDGRLFSGESVTAAARAVLPFGPALLGINCTPTLTLHEPLAELAAVTTLPLAAYGNVGHTDDVSGWTLTDDVPPEEYARYAARWLETAPNLRLLGGCCGTSPAHIRALRALVDG